MLNKAMNADSARFLQSDKFADLSLTINQETSETIIYKLYGSIFYVVNFLYFLSTMRSLKPFMARVMSGEAKAPVNAKD